MDKKNLVYAGAAACIVGVAVVLGLVEDKETAWSAFKAVCLFLMGM